MALSEEQKRKNREAYRKRKKKEDRRALKIFALVIVVIVLLFPVGRFIWGLVGIHIDYSEGIRSVKIIKLSEKGLLWKTYEGEGVLSQEGFATTYVWRFSIDSNNPNREEVLEALKTAFESGETVRVVYEQKAGAVPWRGKTTYFVHDVRFSYGS